ncbi:MAG TPA: DUF3617 family protein [Sphingomicrobium sp.]|nr:DUF3617 family protein [Sphingomicrobium sp.]
MRGLMVGAAVAALGLAGCSEEAPEPQASEAKAATLTPGLYEAAWTVTEIRSTDKTDPKTSQTVGATGTVEACIEEGPAIDLALFAEGTDQCSPSNSYTRKGRINIQMQCKRAEEAGPVMQTATGTYTDEEFQGEISTSTYFTGFGDYSMMRTVKGRRIGACPESAAEEAQAES